MKKNGLTRMALLSDTGGFGKSGRTETLKLAQRMGVEVVDDQQYGERDTDMTPQLTRIKSSHAQAVFVFGTGQAPAIIARNYRQLAMKLPLYTSHGQASMEFVRLSGEAAEGIRMPSPALQVARSLPASDPQREVSVNYAEAFEGRYKVEVSTFGGYAHDGLLMVADAIRRAGGTDRAKLRQALEDTKGFVGVSGIYTMTPEDHMGLDISAFRMVEVRKGVFQALP